MLQLIAYNLILISMLPAIFLWVFWRLVRGKSRQGWAQRLGLLWDIAGQIKGAGEPSPPPRIWVHACSVGEVSAVLPVIKILRERLPNAVIFLSTITPTGQIRAQRSCKEADAIFYFPFDVLPCMWLALRILRPNLCILTEKELWPNFLALCQINRVPVVVVNGILSDRTPARARWFGGFLRWLAGMVTFFSVQTERDQNLLRDLGVSKKNIAVDGNTKFDQPIPAPGKEQTLARLLGWGEETISLAAGSTHAGEEEVVLEAFRRLRKTHPMASLLIAPRHPERAGAVGALIEKSGLPWVRRSELNSEGDNEWQTTNKVVILDTIGELSLAYRLARASFVGGSLVSFVGGHNPLEVTAEGRPVFFGPHMQNCRDIASLLCEEAVGYVVKDAAELASGWQKALENTAWLSDMEQRTKAVMQCHQGAALRAANRALALLSEKETKERARDLRIGNLNVPQLLPLDIPSSSSEAAPFSASSKLARGKQYLLEVIQNKRKGFLPDILRAGLAGLSSLYGAVLAANLALYDFHLLRRKHINSPVISIGNLTMGGTGKTLATQAVCSWLQHQGKAPAILSRGYGGNSSLPRLVFDGKRLKLGPKEAGDEPFLLAASLPGVQVLVGKDRRKSAEMALSLGAQVMVLDDGFQYWKIEKDFELVLVDALNPFGNGRLVPCGLLREPPAALRRADAVWITHSDLVERERLDILEETLGNLAPGVPIACTLHQPVALCDFESGDRIGLWTLEGKRILALSGLGNPFSFELMLKKLGTQVIPARFPDHHSYGEEEVISAIGKNENISMIITTAKDAVRLPQELRTKLPLRILEVKLARLRNGNITGMNELLEETFSWLGSDE